MTMLVQSIDESRAEHGTSDEPSAPRRDTSQEQPSLLVPFGVGVVVGQLIGLIEEDGIPLVNYPGEPKSAVRAISVVELRGSDIGRRVVLAFECADGLRPVILGVLCEQGRSVLRDAPGSVDLDVDGKRLTVSAREQLVLRCGKARITLTKAGKVLIEGAYVMTRSSGSNKIKGASVEIN